mgnify:CR=1 FL=1
MNSSDRINACLKALPGSRYLEIGVARGATFFNVDAAVKVAVDPRFRFSPSERSHIGNETYYSMTSDDYFKIAIRESHRFDVIFLDGLHTYSQTLRDFLSSLALAEAHTIWLIDDTIPTSAIAAEPNLNRVREARHILGCADDQTWMGDVYKVVAFINSNFPQFTCLTTEGHGQTFILPIESHSGTGGFENLHDIEMLNYVDTILLQETLLRPTSIEEIIDKIKSLKLQR